jgi:hypothetical protein
MNEQMVLSTRMPLYKIFTILSPININALHAGYSLGFAQQLIRNFKNCGARLARRKNAGISCIFRAFATQPAGMRRCLKCEVIFARALTFKTEGKSPVK